MKKTIDSKVVSVKTQKTVIVEVIRRTPHPLYKKLVKRSKRIKADTGEFSVRMGDLIRIEETRPISKDKHFKVIKILEEAKE